jgi:hypothetical protein
MAGDLRALSSDDRRWYIINENEIMRKPVNGLHRNNNHKI